MMMPHPALSPDLVAVIGKLRQGSALAGALIRARLGAPQLPWPG